MGISKVLVANRGEIALRVFRTCRERGIKTVAVASDADRQSLHTEFADERIFLPGNEARDTYLNADLLLAACRETGADAVHPGYGFLSERASFAEAVQAAGLTFIGPSSAAMRRLGDKISAKELAVSQDVPITPGFFRAGASDAELAAAAEEIGFPVMLKASAGGGGRGMRAVFNPSTFLTELRLASEEALKAFGDGQMMVEKLVLKPRHIEVQLVADASGEVAVLFERECSLQRRHQKVIEEAPAPSMTDELWQKMRSAAIRLAKEAGYQGAGTVEFMVSDETQEFYFLEVNARLQVEHPVTEMITGVNLVGLQLDLAEGKLLKDLLPVALLEGDRRAIRGHAIEARVVAEDPAREFLPSVGKILAWHAPVGAGIRVDAGFAAGKEVSPYYDSLLGKVIAFGAHRSAATATLVQALQQTHILGVHTNIEYLLHLLGLPAFASGEFDTKFIEREVASWQPGRELPLGLYEVLNFQQESAANGPKPSGQSVWNLGDSWRLFQPNKNPA